MASFVLILSSQDYMILMVKTVSLVKMVEEIIFNFQVSIFDFLFGDFLFISPTSYCKNCSRYVDWRTKGTSSRGSPAGLGATYRFPPFPFVELVMVPLNAFADRCNEGAGHSVAHVRLLFHKGFLLKKRR